MSAHSRMHRMFPVVFLLLAVSFGSQAGPAETQRKAVAGTRNESHQTSSKTKAKVPVKASVKAGSKAPLHEGSGKPARRTVRRSKARGAVRGGVRKTRYTPERNFARAGVEGEATSSFAAGYKSGYDAGLAAARRQLGREGGAANLTPRDAQPARGAGSGL